jgi:hypothetical protein
MAFVLHDKDTGTIGPKLYDKVDQFSGLSSNLEMIERIDSEYPTFDYLTQVIVPSEAKVDGKWVRSYAVESLSDDDSKAKKTAYTLGRYENERVANLGGKTVSEIQNIVISNLDKKVAGDNSGEPVLAMARAQYTRFEFLEAKRDDLISRIDSGEVVDLDESWES